MSKRKFEGFGINRQSTFNFETSQPPQRLFVPPSSRSGAHDHYEDTDLDNIDYDDREADNDNDDNDNNQMLPISGRSSAQNIDGKFRSKRDARKGGERKGGSGKGVRGVDFGLGIGYNTESNNTSTSSAVPNRSAAVNSLKTGMRAQFKNTFVAASSKSQNEFVNSSPSTYANKGMVLRGFVSGGTIGGDNNVQMTNTTNAANKPGASTILDSGDDASRNSKPRERRRPSGWDR